MTVYVFGNIFVTGDDVVFPLAKSLQGLFPQITFQGADPNENFPPKGERNPIILDTVKGINKATLLRFSDLQQIQKSPISPHDYDLLLHLLLLKKMGKIETITIIGVPFGEVSEEIFGKVRQIIASLL